MKVLHVIAGAKDGGAESIMRDAVVALAEAGVAQYVVTRAHNKTRLAEFAALDVPVTLAQFDNFWRVPTSLAVQHAVDVFQPDVCHYWMARAGTFAKRSLRARSIGWYGDYYKLRRFRNCAWHAAMTPDIVRYIKGEGVPEDRVVLLDSYANLAPATPTPRASLDTPDGAPAILALGRLHKVKAFDILLDAVAGLPGAYLWIAGTGPEEAALKAQADKLKIADRVRFLGWREDRAALMAACDIIAFPSRYEPFGNVTIEAWAAGRPLVVADAAGPAQTVTNEHDALLVPKDNVAALRAALARVIGDKALAQKLVENGTRSYEARFTKAAFVKAATDLYARVIASA